MNFSCINSLFYVFWNNIRSLSSDTVNIGKPIVQFVDSTIFPHAPSIIQNLGLGVISIFIATAVLLQPREDSTFAWDNLIIFNSILIPKEILRALIYIFIPLLFWSENKNISIRFSVDICIMSICFCGFLIFFRILNKCVDWIKSTKLENDFPEDNEIHNFRLEFIDNLIKSKNAKKLKQVWNTTWIKCIKQSDFEAKLITKFFGSLFGIYQENVEYRDEVQTTFYQYLEKRNLHNPKIQKTLLEILIKFYGGLSDNERNNYFNSSLFNIIEQMANVLCEKGFLSVLSFHGVLKGALNDISISDDKKIIFIYNYVAPNFINNINNDNRFKKDFLSVNTANQPNFSWIVTPERYKDVFCIGYAYAFVNWVIPQFNSENFSENIRDVIAIIFPDAEPNSLLRLIHLKICGSLLSDENLHTNFLSQIRAINKLNLYENAFSELYSSLQDIQEKTNDRVNVAIKLYKKIFIEIKIIGDCSTSDSWKEGLDNLKNRLAVVKEKNKEAIDEVEINKYLELIKKTE